MQSQQEPFTYFLIDCALVPSDKGLGQLFLKLEEQGRAQYLYQDGKEVSPLLIQPNTEETTELLAIHKKCPGFYLNQISTKLSMLYLFSYWGARFKTVTTEQGEEYFLRFADSRILSILPLVMTPLQWGSFTAPLTSLAYTNRDFQLENIKLRADNKLDKTERLLDDLPSWTDTQIQQFEDLSKPDEIMSVIQEYDPQIIDKVGHKKAHTAITQRWNEVKDTVLGKSDEEYANLVKHCARPLYQTP